MLPPRVDDVTLTLSQVLFAILAMAGGAGTLGAIIAAGVLQRWIRPAIRDEIRAHEGESATVDARRATIRAVVDDQVRRDDGVIRSHTRERDDLRDTEMRELRQTLATVLDELAQLRGMLTAYLDRHPDRPTPARPLMSPVRRPTPAHGSPTR